MSWLHALADWIPIIGKLIDWLSGASAVQAKQAATAEIAVAVDASEIEQAKETADAITRANADVSGRSDVVDRLRRHQF